MVGGKAVAEALEGYLGCGSSIRGLGGRPPAPTTTDAALASAPDAGEHPHATVKRAQYKVSLTTNSTTTILLPIPLSLYRNAPFPKIVLECMEHSKNREDDGQRAG